VPSSLAEYHDLVQTLLTDSALNQAYRTRGYQAILERHTYAHRALSLLKLLSLSIPGQASYAAR
jgi:spore maturation protein CgeB